MKIGFKNKLLNLNLSFRCEYKKGLIGSGERRDSSRNYVILGRLVSKLSLTIENVERGKLCRPK